MSNEFSYSLRCFTAHEVYSGKDVLALLAAFKTATNIDEVHHVTKYCNVIGPHCTVWQDMACIRSSPDPFLLFLAKVGLAHETHVDMHAVGVDPV